MRRNGDEDLRRLERTPFDDMTNGELAHLERTYARLGQGFERQLDRVRFEIEEREPTRILPVVFRTWDSTYRAWGHERSEEGMDGIIDGLFVTEPGSGYRVQLISLAPKRYGDGYKILDYQEANYNDIVTLTRRSTKQEIDAVKDIVEKDINDSAYPMDDSKTLILKLVQKRTQAHFREHERRKRYR